MSMLCQTPASAQQIPTLGTLPSEIAAAIRAAPLTQSLIPVSGDERFDQQIIKADEISFAEGARITLTNLDVPWIVVAAQRIKFAKPDTYSIIQRDPSVLTGPRGADGAAGSTGADHPGETDRTGNTGYTGGPGGPGRGGGSKSLPTNYLVVGSLQEPKGPIPPGLLNLVIAFRGLDGGDGGTGSSG